MSMEHLLDWIVPSLLAVIGYLLIRLIDRIDKFEDSTTKSLNELTKKSIEHEGEDRTLTRVFDLQIKQTQINIENLIDAFYKKTKQYDEEIKVIKAHIFSNGKN